MKPDLTIASGQQDGAFGLIAQQVRLHATQRPEATALQDEAESLTWEVLDSWMDRIAAALQRDGLLPGDSIAICALSSVRYAAVFLGALRAGVAVAPLAPSSTPDGLHGMLCDSRAKLLFSDATTCGTFIGMPRLPGTVALDDASGCGGARRFGDWMAPEGAVPASAGISPDTPFNIIYSSGTTGQPKGIVQGHGMRWGHVVRSGRHGYGPDSITLVSTPLYSNTTLVAFFPTIAYGGSSVLMSKFDAARFLKLAEAHRVTHVMLVPVQYKRLLDHPDFGTTDLSAFRYKFCTSAPFGAALKAEVLARWPGALVEFYGMTEGGATCLLDAHLHPGKLHTVGRPAPGCEIRLIDETGQEVPPGAPGEIVGRSASMMTAYLNQPAKTREAEWFSPQGVRFIRTGDLGRFDDDGFLVLIDRKKDMVISGGYNIYPSDLEAVLLQHPDVVEAAVVGVPSEAWGETPVAFGVLTPASKLAPEALQAWANSRLGKTQRISEVHLLRELPRSAIGKVLKRELQRMRAA
ncbi:long-chain fatty acid--CoA ligase [Ramlibacter sp. G-1-2-2]|uniref:Long-chain fatty acid--CoA ligase n=1 Tax=Ramlibacter agri TaxID=2728837 RepID=A0A848GUG1_9BURK|nr:AMP-binding protein [Ramlibacter agri]NML42255.1 long-chain fatty acid--CoA ligase [Ramlibacter agri]